MSRTDGRLASAIEMSATILKEFALCDSCLGRMHARSLGRSSCVRLGSQIRMRLGVKPAGCYICKGLLDGLPGYVVHMKSIADDTDHDSFVVGVKLKPSVMDRDDLVRSRFRMQGADGIKSEVSRRLTAMLRRRTRKKVDYRNPDLTMLADMKTETCHRRSRPMLICGRYTKSRRGLPQRGKACDDCRGHGCIFCSGHGMTGFESVEGVISRLLYDVFECKQARFTWTGGEDKDSLVGGGGRPFIAKILDPAKRHARLKREADLDGVRLHDMRRIRAMPVAPVPFRSHVVVRVSTKASVTAGQLARLKGLADKDITVSDGSRTVSRRIHRISVQCNTAHAFTVKMVADGGIPIKGLVEGDMTHPDLPSMLGCACICEGFDFEDILAGRQLHGL